MLGKLNFYYLLFIYNIESLIFTFCWGKYLLIVVVWMNVTLLKTRVLPVWFSWFSGSFPLLQQKKLAFISDSLAFWIETLPFNVFVRPICQACLGEVVQSIQLPKWSISSANSNTML